MRRKNTPLDEQDVSLIAEWYAHKSASQIAQRLSNGRSIGVQQIYTTVRELRSRMTENANHLRQAGKEEAAQKLENFRDERFPQRKKVPVNPIIDTIMEEFLKEEVSPFASILNEAKEVETIEQ